MSVSEYARMMAAQIPIPNALMRDMLRVYGRRLSRFQRLIQWVRRRIA